MFLQQHQLHIDIHDPLANKEEVKNQYNVNLNNDINIVDYDSIIIAVAHNEFRALDFKKVKSKGNTIIFDTKGFLNKELVDGRL